MNSEQQVKFVHTKAELQAVRAQIAALERSSQTAGATSKQIQQEAGDGPVWIGIGKMFMRSTLTECQNLLTARRSDAAEQIEALKKKEAYHLATYQSLAKALNEGN